MRTETCNLVAHLFLKSDNDRHSYNHHRQSDGNANHSNEYRRPRNLFAGVIVTIDTMRDK